MNIEDRYLSVLYPLRKRSRVRKICVLDIETNGLDARPSAFRLGVILGEDGGYKAFTSRKKFLKEITSMKHNGHIHFAHNGGKFDYLVLFQNYIKQKGVIMRDGSLIKFDVYHGKNKITFADSLRLLPVSVEALGESLGLPKGQRNSKFDDARCRVGDINEADIKYCLRDCEIVLRYLQKLRALNSGGMPLTLASLALQVFKRDYLAKPVYVSKLDEVYKDVYHGGRVEAFKVGKVDDACLDVNSLYPYAMTLPQASTRYQYHLKKCSIDYFIKLVKKYKGLATVYINYNPKGIPIIPINQNGKLIFPIGKFHAKVSFDNLKYALEKGDLEIMDVKDVYYALVEENMFSGFIRDMGKKKKLSKGADRLIYKLILNSLYGKFGESRREDIHVAHTQRDVLQFCSKMRDRIIEVKDAGDFVIIRYKTENERTSHTCYTIASQITDLARLHLARIVDFLLDKGIEVHYTDTDSVFISYEALDKLKGWDMIDEAEFGKLKVENKRILEVKGLKNYVYQSGSKVKRAVKGVPLNAIEVDGQYEYKHIVGVKESIRRSLRVGQPLTVRKSLNVVNDKRIFDENGNSKPICIND